MYLPLYWEPKQKQKNIMSQKSKYKMKHLDTI